MAAMYFVLIALWCWVFFATVVALGIGRMIAIRDRNV